MKKVAIILLIVVVVLVGFGTCTWNGFRIAQEAKKKELEKGIVKVDRGAVTVQVVESGALEAKKAVEVKSRVGGRLAKLYVDAGDRVRQGQIIAVVDPQETQLRVNQGQAQLEGAQSQIRQSQIERQKRAQTIQTDLARARSRLAQIQEELRVQPELTRTAIAAAQTALTSAQESRNLLVNVTQPNARVAAEKEVRDAEASLSTAQSELRRREALLAKGYVASRDVEQQKLQVELAANTLDRARETLSRVDTQQSNERRQADERIKEAQANLERAQANSIQDDVKREEYKRAVQDVKDAEIAKADIDRLSASTAQQRAQARQIEYGLRDTRRELGETDIRAPIDGIVTKRSVQEGELVASLGSFSSGTPIVTIEDRSTMIARLQVNEIDMAKLKVNMPASIEIDALPNRTFRGHVSRIAPSNVGANAAAAGASPASADAVVKYEVEVTLDEISPTLKSGMSARCTMVVSSKPDVLRLPIDYVGQDKDQRFAMVVGADGKAKRVPVTVGETSGAFIEILSGLKEGDRVKKPEFTGPKRKGVMQFGPDDGGEESGDSGKEGAGAKSSQDAKK